MVEGKTISTFRDIVVIVGMLILCFVGMQDVAARTQARREQEARFAVARNAIGKLDETYKQLVANKSINEAVLPPERAGDRVPKAHPHTALHAGSCGSRRCGAPGAALTRKACDSGAAPGKA